MKSMRAGARKGKPSPSSVSFGRWQLLLSSFHSHLRELSEEELHLVKAKPQRTKVTEAQHRGGEKDLLHGVCFVLDTCLGAKVRYMSWCQRQEYEGVLFKVGAANKEVLLVMGVWASEMRRLRVAGCQRQHEAMAEEMGYAVTQTATGIEVRGQRCGTWPCSTRVSSWCQLSLETLEVTNLSAYAQQMREELSDLGVGETRRWHGMQLTMPASVTKWKAAMLAPHST